MPLERRVDAAGLFWDDEHSADQQMEAVAAIATHMKFRPRSVVTLAPEKRAKYLAQLPTVTDAIAARALVNDHLERQRPMMGAFLDLLGITHDNGLISDELDGAIAADRIKAGADVLASSYPAADVRLYFETLLLQDPGTWGELAALR